MKIGLIAVLLFAHALAWGKLDLTAANPFTNELVYVDWSTLQVIGQSNRVWVLADRGKPDEHGIRFVYGEHEYQCELGRTRSLTLNFYDEKLVTPVGSELEHGEWITPTPYSLAGVVLAAVCADR